MSEAPSLGQVVRAAEMCGWPPITAFGRTLNGEADWRAIAAAAPPVERAWILSRLGRHELLVITEGGRARTRRWCDRQWARPTDDDSAEPIRDRLTREARIYGDETLVAAIVAALCRVPACVRDIVTEESHFFAVGGRLRGWTSQPIDTAGLAPIQVSGKSSDEVVSIACHELAHRWNAPSLKPGVHALTSHGFAELVNIATRERWPLETIAMHHKADERLAQLLTTAWTCDGPELMRR